MKKILIATDGSAYSLGACKLLARLPHAEPLAIEVVSVVNTPQVYMDGSQAVWFVDHVKEQHDQAELHFEKIKQVFAGTDAEVVHQVKQGRIGATIVDAARTFDAELIVMGARGHSQVARILLGSTSDYVATHAECSVLVVRPTEASGQDIPLRIAISYEDAGPAQAAIDEIAELKWAAESTVHLVSVLPPLDGFHGDNDPTMEAQMRANQAIRRAASDLKDAANRVRTQIVDSDHVGEGIVRYAEDNRCDLVVVGETSRSALGRMLLGSVSRYILRHANCSVFIARNRAIKLRGNDSARSLQATQGPTTKPAGIRG